MPWPWWLALVVTIVVVMAFLINRYQGRKDRELQHALRFDLDPRDHDRFYS